MKNKCNKKVNKNIVDNDVERILEATWKNWASRRACEQTHTPEYIKRQKKWKKENND